MSAKRYRPSLLGGLLWTGLGVLFLLRNFSIGPDFWAMAGRYWPILLILLGLGKVIDYFRQKEGVSIRIGEVFGILFLLVIGTAITKISNTNFARVLTELPIEIGGSSVRPGRWIGTSYSYNESAAYHIAPGTPLRIENSYGQVSVSPGSDGEVRVNLRKTVYSGEEASAKSIAGGIKLEGGSEVKPEAEGVVKPEAEPAAKGKAEPLFVVRTNRDSLSARDLRFNTDMEVFVPRKSNLVVQNAFGELRVMNVDGNLDLSTSHNSLEVHDCKGDVKASNRYAETRLLNITGNATVDARGRVHLETIQGDVNVRDEFAAVEVREVQGKVTVSNSDSKVTVEGVTKPVVVEGQGCEVVARDLSDTLRVVTSHKRVKISEIASNVVLETRYANISLDDVKGNVDIASNNDRINLDNLGGYLKVKADGSSVQVNHVTGPVEIATTRKDVVVNNFEAGCSITNEYGEVTLSTGTLAKGGLSVKSRNGDVQLYLPADAQFQIDATARNGRVVSDFPGLEPVQGPGDVGTLKGKIKSGGPKIVLETEYSSIRLRTREGEEAEKPAGNTRRTV